MAEAASAVPTFKLVLVGDGGTGKVRAGYGRVSSPLDSVARPPSFQSTVSLAKIAL